MTSVQTTEVVRSNVTLDNDSTEKKKSQPQHRNKPHNPSKNIALLLYPDNPLHISALAKVISKWDYTYIVHDKDEFSNDSQDDLDMHGGASDGDVLTDEDKERLKKKHIHCLIHLPNKKEASQVAKELKLEHRFVQRISDRTAMLCYLVHTGMYDKHQYKPEEVQSNRPSLFREALYSVNTDSERLMKIISIIQNKKCVTVTFAMKVLAESGMTQFALKNFSLIKQIVEEQRESAMCFGTVPRSYSLYKSQDMELVEDLPF